MGFSQSRLQHPALDNSQPLLLFHRENIFNLKCSSIISTNNQLLDYIKYFCGVFKFVFGDFFGGKRRRGSGGGVIFKFFVLFSYV